jgi:hypothetical protein
LQADVVGAAVACERNKFIGVFNFALAFFCVVSGFAACDCRRNIFERGVNIAFVPSGERIQNAGNFQATCCNAANGFVFIVYSAKNSANGNARAATGAQTVPANKAFGLATFLFKIIRHN